MKDSNKKFDFDARSDRKKSLRTGKLLFVFVLILVLAAIGLAVAAFIMNGNGQNADTDLGGYLTVFSILITAIAIVLPITSYVINKDELKKIAEEFDNKLSDADKKIGYLDVRHIELLENLIKRNNISKVVTEDPYVIVGVEYINALLLFENGAYGESQLRINNAIKYIFESKLYRVTTDDERVVLLIVKVFNIYRKLAGRTRFYNSHIIGDLEQLINRLELDIENHDVNKLLYETAVYLYVKTRLDKIEKTFDKEDSSIANLDETIEKLKEYSGLLYYTLKAKKQYISAYYRLGVFSNESKALYNLASDSALIAYDYTKERFGAMFETEVEKYLVNDCMFTIAKVLEKSSYGIENYGKALDTSRKIVENLIERKTDAKYYLELSEIYKKNNQMEESNEAAIYGFLLAPTDPLIAAQCAYVYLREYLLDRTNKSHLYKARDYIKTAHWIYTREKAKYGDHINVKFSYIASLNAIISAYTFMDSKKGSEVTKDDIKDIINKKICRDIENSIMDNENNVPNYKRIFIIFIELSDFCTDKNILEFFNKQIVEYIIRFKNNEAFNFAPGEKFYKFSQSIKNIPDSPDNAVEKVKELLKPEEFVDNI